MEHIINQSFRLKEHVTTPLIANMEVNFRVFLCDMVMLSYQSGINAAAFVLYERNKDPVGNHF